MGNEDLTTAVTGGKAPSPGAVRYRRVHEPRASANLMPGEGRRRHPARVALLVFFALGVVFLAATPSLVLAQPSYIQPDDGASILAKPRAFQWTGYGASGSAFRVRWRKWGRLHTSAQGRIDICWSMGVGCSRNLPVRITAGGRRDLSFSGAHEYIYCHLVFRGNLDPQNPGRPLAMTLPIPNACRRT